MKVVNFSSFATYDKSGIYKHFNWSVWSGFKDEKSVVYVLEGRLSYE